MKPSERIKELRKNGDIEGHELSVAILLYLDEQWEENQIATRPVSPPVIPTDGNTGEWCHCGAWKPYGVADTHNCPGYKVTC